MRPGQAGWSGHVSSKWTRLNWLSPDWTFEWDPLFSPLQRVSPTVTLQTVWWEMTDSSLTYLLPTTFHCSRDGPTLTACPDYVCFYPKVRWFSQETIWSQSQFEHRPFTSGCCDLDSPDPNVAGGKQTNNAAASHSCVECNKPEAWTTFLFPEAVQSQQL